MTSATDNLDHIPDGTSAILVGMRANAVQVLCRARAVVDAAAISADARSMLTHALQLCPTVDWQLPWYELKRNEGTTTCTSWETRTASR